MLFISLSIIWGMPYLFIRIAVEALSPFFVVFARVGMAAVIMLVVAAFTGQLSGLKHHWKWVVVFGVVEMAFPFGAITIAEQQITSSFAALLVAAVPLMSAFIAWRLGLDHDFDRRRIVGLLIGIAGVAALVGIDVRGSTLLAVGLMAITIVGYAFGPIIVAEKLSDAPPVAVIAGSLTVTSILYAPLAIVNWPTRGLTAPEWTSILMLGIVCTAIAFIVFFALVAEVGPSRTTVITYLNPAVALILGVLVLGEPITIGLVIGFPLVLLGSYLATRRQSGQPTGVPEGEPHP